MHDEPLPSMPHRSAVATQDVLAEAQAPIHLTPREAEIAHYVSLGESNKQIARRLGISDYTVRDHVSNLLRKAGASKRSRLAVLLCRMPHGPLSTVPAFGAPAPGTLSVTRSLAPPPLRPPYTPARPLHAKSRT